MYIYIYIYRVNQRYNQIMSTRRPSRRRWKRLHVAHRLKIPPSPLCSKDSLVLLTRLPDSTCVSETTSEKCVQ